MKKYVKIAIFVLLFFTYFSPPVMADSILNDLAPSIFGPRDRGPKPEDTLIAPFSDQTGTVNQNQIAKPAPPQKLDNVLSLTVAHQDRAYMAQWAATQAAAVFTYNPNDGSATSSEGPAGQAALFKKAFLSTAQSDVQALLANPYFTDRFNGQKMRIKAFVETPATIQNEGVFGDAYRWLIDVPVTITFYPDGYLNDQITRSNKFETKTIIVRLQIARVSGEYPDGCAIERFTTSTPLP